MTLKDKLMKKGDQQVQSSGKPKTLADQINALVPQFAKALPKHMSPERLARIALTVYRQTPGLAECTPESFFGALMQAAQLGLEPGIVGHAYLLPFMNRRTGRKEVQFIIGYKGMIDLARRSGQIESITARPVYTNDYFKVTYGLNETMEHIPWHMREDVGHATRGELRGVYLVCKFKDGGHLIDYMPKAEIEEHRLRSLAADSGPWKTDYEAMALKTIIRKNFKWLPVSIEIQEQIAIRDETIRDTPDDDGTIMVDYSVMVDKETGEVLEPEQGEQNPS